MINYHPIGDLYHCYFRLLFIMKHYGYENCEWDKLKIMDFYLLFPHLIKDIRMPRINKDAKKAFSDIEKPFENFSSSSRLYFILGETQESAVRALIAQGIVDRDLFVDKTIVKIDSFDIVSSLNEEFKAELDRKNAWINHYFSLFSKIDLLGANGIKQRSGISEYRYDPV